MIFVVALKSEATPFVNELKLRRWPSEQPYTLYRSEQHCVLVTGVGAEKASKAVNEFMLAHPEVVKAQWINVGIAGAYGLSLGQLVWINEVSRQEGDQMCPVQLPTTINHGWAVKSVGWPQRLSEGDEIIYDMELATLIDCLSARGVSLKCAKVISDNKRAGIGNITPQYVVDLIRHQLPKILQAALPEDKL